MNGCELHCGSENATRRNVKNHVGHIQDASVMQPASSNQMEP